MEKKILNCLIIAFFFIAPLHGYAEEIFFKQGVNTIDDIVNALAPTSQSAMYKTRSAGTAVNVQKRAISLAINFKKDSSHLTPEAKRTLDILGKSLNKERLKEFNFIVQGHTDASGTAPYNMDLSNRRAETVKKHLVTQYNINAKRLVTEGKGETELCDRTLPYSGINRRVRIINAGR